MNRRISFHYRHLLLSSCCTTVEKEKKNPAALLLTLLVFLVLSEEWFCCLLRKAGQRISKINTFHTSLEISSIKYLGAFQVLSEENDFCGINRACLKGSAEIKDLHLSAIKYDRKQSPEGHGIFAYKELFQTVLK